MLNNKAFKAPSPQNYTLRESYPIEPTKFDYFRF